MVVTCARELAHLKERWKGTEDIINKVKYEVKIVFTSLVLFIYRKHDYKKETLLLIFYPYVLAMKCTKGIAKLSFFFRVSFLLFWCEVGMGDYVFYKFDVPLCFFQVVYWYQKWSSLLLSDHQGSSTT